MTRVIHYQMIKTKNSFKKLPYLQNQVSRLQVAFFSKFEKDRVWSYSNVLQPWDRLHILHQEAKLDSKWLIRLFSKVGHVGCNAIHAVWRSDSASPLKWTKSIIHRLSLQIGTILNWYTHVPLKFKFLIFVLDTQRSCDNYYDLGICEQFDDISETVF